MTTDNLGVVMPDILEEFGPGLKFDVMLSMSHALMRDKIDSSRITGFNIDKNGNFRITFNFYAQILVQDKENKKSWLNGREVFLGLTLKGKAIVKETSPSEKVLIILPKTAEASTCKILKNNGEEAIVEQMLITSGLNVQLEQALNLLKPLELPMKNPVTLPELECLGFSFSDFNVNFRKGYLEIG